METYTTIEDINKRVAALNGRAQTRRIGLSDFAQVVTEAQANGYGYTTAGLIRCNSYKYSADSRGVAAIKIKGRIYITSQTINAKSSPVTWFGPPAETETSLDKWYKAQTVESLKKSATTYFYWVRLSPQLVNVLLTLKSNDSGELGELGEVIITKEASLSVGNCLPITNEVATFFGNVPQKAKVVAEAFPRYKKYIRRTAAMINAADK
jgi:hypothetical protein